MKKFLFTILSIILCASAFAQDNKIAENGELSPDFQYEDSTGTVFSLKDFKGKYLFIDIWATYCSPCRAEMPHLEAIEKKLSKKNIVFVGIATDQDKEEWLNFLKKHKLKGIQLIMNRKWISFMHKYNVETIPRYILIDKEGKIINKNMPRPSDPECSKILEALD